MFLSLVTALGAVLFNRKVKKVFMEMKKQVLRNKIAIISHTQHDEMKEKILGISAIKLS